ncbi:MAG: prepilin-type N-terminal cleavage/methylation domain-containing protein [Longimicrobiales bacterium]
MTSNVQRSGFSLVEVIIALMILSVGILAMGASTGHVMAQIQAADLRTERMGAIRESAEILRGTAWGSLETACANAGTNFGTEHYTVRCSVLRPSSNLKRVQLITEGPGFRSGKFTTTVADTFAISIANPVP